MKIKKITDDKICKFCEKSTEIPLTGNMLCPKKGIVEADFVCVHFKYDPFKRVPKKARPSETMDFVSLDD